MCVSFLSCKKKKKKKETERKWKGLLSLSFIKPRYACFYSDYSLILQLIQFLDNPLSHQIQNSKAYLLLTVSYHNYYSFINSSLHLGRSFLLAKTFF